MTTSLSPPPLPVMDPERPFARDEIFERLWRLCSLNKGARVLELGTGDASFGLWVATHQKNPVVVAGVAPAAEEQVKSYAKELGVASGLSVTSKPPEDAELPSDFGLVASFNRKPLVLSKTTASVGAWLVPNGRLAVTYPVRVSRTPPAPQLEYWELQLGERLGSPTDLLGQLAKSGFEPEWIESLNDAELDEYYRTAEPRWKGDSAKKAELEVYRQHAGHNGVSFALAVARRKEPGEKPPKARDRG